MRGSCMNHERLRQARSWWHLKSRAGQLSRLLFDRDVLLHIIDKWERGFHAIRPWVTTRIELKSLLHWGRWRIAARARDPSKSR